MRTALLCLLLIFAPVAALAQGPVVFAAASLKTALDQVAAAWDGPPPVLVYAGTSALARQIDQGAPADLVLTASADWAEWLASRDLIDADTRVPLLGNRLVLIGGAGQTELPLTTDAVLDRLGDNGVLAMALVDAVPAGQYGRAALVHLGLWDALAPRIAQTDNVRAALALVARGEAPMGVVYATDARADDRVAVLASIPVEAHPPIEIVLAKVTQSRHPDADAFFAFLQSDAALALFRAEGFL